MWVCTVSASTHTSMEIHTFRATQICHNNGFKYTAITCFISLRFQTCNMLNFAPDGLTFFYFLLVHLHTSQPLKLVTRQFICSPNMLPMDLRGACFVWLCHVLALLWILSTSTLISPHCSAFFVLFFLAFFQAPGLNSVLYRTKIQWHAQLSLELYNPS